MDNLSFKYRITFDIDIEAPNEELAYKMVKDLILDHNELVIINTRMMSTDYGRILAEGTVIGKNIVPLFGKEQVEYRMKFGKYKGVEISKVPAGYLLYIEDFNSLDNTLKTYIKENREQLLKTVNSGRWYNKLT